MKSELKILPGHLEYAFLEEGEQKPVIIASDLTKSEKEELVRVLKKRKNVIAWKITDIKGISPSYCSHKIKIEEGAKSVMEHQRRLNPNMQEVVKKMVVKLLDAGIIYSISDSPWVSHVQVVPKKGGMIVVINERNKLIPTRTVTDGFSGYFQIAIDPIDQENTTFTCPSGTFAYRHMPFGLCNAPATFQRCMTAIFHDMVEKFMDVFMDDFSVYEGIVLGQKVSKVEIEVDREKIEAIAKLPSPTNVKGVRNAPFDFSKECLAAFVILKEKLPNALIIIDPNWNMPFEIMCGRAWPKDIANYLAGDYLPKGLTHQQKKKLFSEIKYYFSDEPYLFRSCADGIIMRCVFGKEIRDILEHCHNGTTGGHHGVQYTAKKVFDAGFYWHTIFKDVATHVTKCDAYQRTGNISARNEIPQRNIQAREIFDVWGMDFMGQFPSSKGNKYILVAVDYVSKLAEAQALPTNDARVMVKFLKKLFSRFGVSNALISDTGTHFANDQLAKVLQKYRVHHIIFNTLPSTNKWANQNYK
ncbi:uncharacterized protein LOC128133721 [Lactuca sativa]|uniref:uncharacterized protein LOC128133721 n=1 Tax=Lactuca sativa TaxID=4236 RepID=UPI0022AED6DA|nr:uncharacterized protein LOC128133721 [Lactuca sativa]